jgi:protein gp37
VHWGTGAPRRKIKGALATLAKIKSGRRVFVQSMSDLFDNEVPLDWFREAWDAILSRPDLRFQIVTKRVSMVEKRLAATGHAVWPKNIGLLATVCNQDEANRNVPRLLELKDLLGISWVGLSCEPILRPIDLTAVLEKRPISERAPYVYLIDALTGATYGRRNSEGDRQNIADTAKLDWVIVGGESGKHARPMHPDWARTLRDQCAAAGVPFFFKQWGEWASSLDRDKDDPDWRKDYTNDYIDHGKSKWLNLQGGCGFHGERFHVMARIGKTRAGDLLDGVQHHNWPEAKA